MRLLRSNSPMDHLLGERMCKFSSFSNVYNHKQNEKTVVFDTEDGEIAVVNSVGQWRRLIVTSFGFRKLRDRAEYFEFRTSTSVYMRRSDCSDEPKRSRQTIAHFFQPFRAMTPTAARLLRIIQCFACPRREVYRRAQNLRE